MTRFRLDNPRTPCFGSWWGLEEKASFGAYPVAGHLWVFSAFEANNDKAKG